MPLRPMPELWSSVPSQKSHLLYHTEHDGMETLILVTKNFRYFNTILKALPPLRFSRVNIERRVKKGFLRSEAAGSAGGERTVIRTVLGSFGSKVINRPRTAPSVPMARTGTNTSPLSTSCLTPRSTTMSQKQNYSICVKIDNTAGPFCGKN